MTYHITFVEICQLAAEFNIYRYMNDWTTNLVLTLDKLSRAAESEHYKMLGIVCESPCSSYSSKFKRKSQYVNNIVLKGTCNGFCRGYLSISSTDQNVWIDKVGLLEKCPKEPQPFFRCGQQRRFGSLQSESVEAATALWKMLASN